MPMPETAVKQYRASPSRENQVGGARQVLAMEAEAIAEPVEQGTNTKLQARVLAANLGHIPAALLGGNGVHSATLYEKPGTGGTSGAVCRVGWSRH